MPVPVEPPRLFFALWPGEAVREELRKIVGGLRRTLSGRWVESDKLHLTLAFLGPVPASRLPELEAIIQGLDPQAFELVLDRLEYWRHNRILCLGATQAPPGLLDLVRSLTDCLGQAGFEPARRPFMAHMTLARKAAADWSAMALKTPVRWPVGGVVLVESRISNAGSAYGLHAEKRFRTMPEMTAME